jgi:ADP-heptose:LPS heptosyltransferase
MNMSIDALRLLDRILGVPLCWLVTAARRIRLLLLRPKMSMRPPRRVLIIKLSEMGSTVLACPALHELNNRIPGIELFFLVFKNNAAIVDVLGIIGAANIVTVDYTSAKRLLVSGFRAIKRLASERIDTTIDMDFFSRLTALLSFIVCRGNRVGFYRYNDEGLYRGDFLTHRVAYSSQVHTSVAFMALIKSLFAATGDEPYYRGLIDPDTLVVPAYAPDESDVTMIKNKLETLGLRNKGQTEIILINPNSSDIFPLRKWPLVYFAELCQRILAERPNCWLVITGVASEEKDAEFICNRLQSRRCLNFTGKTSFRELLGLYSIASLMVTNDSGPAHFATLLSLPTVVLFGPETPRLYSPIGNHHTTLYSGLPCSPCVSVYNAKQSPCTDNRCLRAITVDQVMQSVLTVVDHRKTELPIQPL